MGGTPLNLWVLANRGCILAGQGVLRQPTDSPPSLLAGPGAFSDGLESLPQRIDGFDETSDVTMQTSRSRSASKKSMRGGALDDVRAGLAEEGEELLVPRLHPWAQGDPPWPPVPPYAAPPLHEEVVRPQRTMQGKESTHSFPL